MTTNINTLKNLSPRARVRHTVAVLAALAALPSNTPLVALYQRLPKKRLVAVLAALGEGCQHCHWQTRGSLRGSLAPTVAKRHTTITGSIRLRQMVNQLTKAWKDAHA